MQYDLRTMRELVAQGKISCYWVQVGLFLNIGWRVHMPKFGDIIWCIMKESHDTLLGGNLIQFYTRAFVKSFYYLLHMREEIEYYMKTYLVAIKIRLSRGSLKNL